MGNTDIKQIGGWVRWPGQERWHALKTWRGLTAADDSGPISLDKNEQTWCGLEVPSQVIKTDWGDRLASAREVEVLRTPEWPKNVEESGTKCGKCMEESLGSRVEESTEHSQR